MINYIGGEDNLPVFMNDLVASFEEISHHYFEFENGAKALCKLQAICADHHCLGILLQIPQGMLKLPEDILF